MKTITFKELNLQKHLVDAITKKGFVSPTQIQEKVIPLIMENKNDILGIAQTGSGKTAAFGLPLLNNIKPGNKTPKAIILTPTRDLALQITAELESYSRNSNIKILTVYGGQAISIQQRVLRRGCDIVVGTPGRVMDFLNRKDLNLSVVDYFVLDEADEMLKMGFIDEVETILSSATSDKRRVYLFSATVPEKIKKLSKNYMKKQVIVEVEKKSLEKNDIEQLYFVCKNNQKQKILTKIIDSNDFFYGIIFCNMKSTVDSLTHSLRKEGYSADCIHGDITQSKREKVLNRFREMKIEILVATDVAARGIDVTGLTHVINYNLPKEQDSYIHRIGRTGRAGKKGQAISLVTSTEVNILKSIVRQNNMEIKEGGKLSVAENKKFDKKSVSVSSSKDSRKVKNYREQASTMLRRNKAVDVVSSLLEQLDNKK